MKRIIVIPVVLLILVLSSTIVFANNVQNNATQSMDATEVNFMQAPENILGAHSGLNIGNDPATDTNVSYFAFTNPMKNVPVTFEKGNILNLLRSENGNTLELLRNVAAAQDAFTITLNTLTSAGHFIKMTAGNKNTMVKNDYIRLDAAKYEGFVEIGLNINVRTKSTVDGVVGGRTLNGNFFAIVTDKMTEQTIGMSNGAISQITTTSAGGIAMIVSIPGNA